MPADSRDLIGTVVAVTVASAGIGAATASVPVRRPWFVACGRPVAATS